MLFSNLFQKKKKDLHVGIVNGPLPSFHSLKSGGKLALFQKINKSINYVMSLDLVASRI